MNILFRYLVFFGFIVRVFSDTKEKVVKLDVGEVRGEKYCDGEFYEFYGVPYATVPTGRNRFKAPLPLEPFGSIKADVRYIHCPQIYLTQDETEEPEIYGQEDCLTMNLLVPIIANENNLLPVLVYIHSGGFAGGNGNMGRLHYLARHDVIVISFNYRLGVIGFACLGTEEIPGNAALKDQVAALRFINKYIKQFGGDPNKVTLAGFSVGATMAELLSLSKSASGLFDKLILESGSALSPFAVNRHPITTAKNIAISIGFNGTGNIEDLNEFLLNADIVELTKKSKNFFLPNSTFGLAPCLENAMDTEPFMMESPLTILQRGDYKQIPVLTGFANMEGISRSMRFDEWSEKMNENFEDFLPADLIFDTAKLRDAVSKDINQYYFKGEEVSHDTIREFVDYFSDSMFKYSILKSAKLHSAKSKLPMFFYEFTYFGELNMKHHFMDKLDGASHRDQTSYLWDFYEFTHDLNDLNTRDRMTTMWTDFVKFEDPTAYESLLIDLKWRKYSKDEPHFMQIGKNLRLKKDLLSDAYVFWDKIYDKYYWSPTPVGVPNTKTKK